MRISFVMPAYNEELLLEETVVGVLPHVDRLLVVDDGSRDDTGRIADALAARFGDKLEVVHHERNRGQGAAVVTGIRALLARGDLDAIGIIASDNQCHPALIPAFRRILEEHADIDVAKGSRFLHPQTLGAMPRFRFWGNRGVSLVMQLILGYAGMSDILHGYLLARSEVFRAMRLDRIADGYDLENTMMTEFRRLGCRFGLVPSPSRYGRERSKIVVHTQIPKTLGRMTAILARRLVEAHGLEKAVPLLVAAGVFSGGATLPLAWAAMRATSPALRVFPAPEGT